MKFISKSSNLLVILRPGMSASPLTGTPAVPTLSVRFKDGVADVEQADLVDMMVKHPGFNSDFISSETVAVDPFKNNRTSSEPAHEITEMKFGTPVARAIKGGDAPKLSPEMQAMVKAAAIEMAKGMLPEMVKSTLEHLVKEKKSKKGRPKSKKVKKEQIDEPKEIVEESVPDAIK